MLSRLLKRLSNYKQQNRRPCPAIECYKGMVPDYKATGLTPEGRQPTKVCMVCLGNGFVGGD